MKDLLVEALQLKELSRAGWSRVGITNAESVAAHTWGVCWLVMALCPDDIDQHRALQIAVLHDLAEVRVGDITPHDKVSKQDKSNMESSALRNMLQARPDLYELWEEYENQRTAEARIVHDLDRLDMALQAIRYRQDQGLDTTEFIVSARRDIKHPKIAAILQQLTTAP
jgi:putative hydrolase of HD superfamily